MVEPFKLNDEALGYSNRAWLDFYKYVFRGSESIPMADSSQTEIWLKLLCYYFTLVNEDLQENPQGQYYMKDFSNCYTDGFMFLERSVWPIAACFDVFSVSMHDYLTNKWYLDT